MEWNAAGMLPCLTLSLNFSRQKIAQILEVFLVKPQSSSRPLSSLTHFFTYFFFNVQVDRNAYVTSKRVFKLQNSKC